MQHCNIYFYHKPYSSQLNNYFLIIPYGLLRSCDLGCHVDNIFIGTNYQGLLCASFKAVPFLFEEILKFEMYLVINLVKPEKPGAGHKYFIET